VQENTSIEEEADLLGLATPLCVRTLIMKLKYLVATKRHLLAFSFLLAHLTAYLHTSSTTELEDS